MAQLLIGIAQVDFTPRPGLPLKGNFRDDYAARGVHDPLYAKAIVVENSAGEKAALAVLDICMLDRDNVAFVRGHISRQTGIPAGRILVAATHTHAGPAAMAMGNLPVTPEKDLAKLLARAATVVALADKNKKASKLRIGCAEENRLSHVRRLLCKDGQTHMNWEKLKPDFVVKELGKPDQQVMALEVLQAGRRRAVLANFGLHPAILAGDNWLYSADYPGYLAEGLRKISGNDLCALFFNGCCGNVNHLDYADPLQGRGYQMTQRVGYMLAAAVQAALNRAVEIKGDKIAVISERLAVQRLKISAQQQKWSEQVIRAAKGRQPKGQVDGLPDIFYATIFREMYKRQLAGEFDRIEIMAIRIGDLGIVGLPGEIFCEFGLAIKKKSPARHTLVIELANDAIGYIPDRIAFKQGGYEPMVGSTYYVPGTGERMAEAAVGMLKKLFGPA